MSDHHTSSDEPLGQIDLSDFELEDANGNSAWWCAVISFVACQASSIRGTCSMPTTRGCCG